MLGCLKMRAEEDEGSILVAVWWWRFGFFFNLIFNNSSWLRCLTYHSWNNNLAGKKLILQYTPSHSLVALSSFSSFLADFLYRSVILPISPLSALSPTIPPFFSHPLYQHRKCFRTSKKKIRILINWSLLFSSISSQVSFHHLYPPFPSLPFPLYMSIRHPWHFVSWALPNSPPSLPPLVLKPGVSISVMPL